MPSFPEQFSQTARTSLDAQADVLNAFFTQAFNHVEKVVELNLSTARASLEDSALTLKQLAAARDAQEFFALSAAQAQPAAARAVAYGRSLAGIASNVQADLTRSAEDQLAQASKRFSDLVENVSRNAPAGTENVVALFKTAIGNANAGYEQFNRNARQAAEAVEENIQNAVGQFARGTETSANAARI